MGRESDKILAEAIKAWQHEYLEWQDGMCGCCQCRPDLDEFIASSGLMIPPDEIAALEEEHRPKN